MWLQKPYRSTPHLNALVENCLSDSMPANFLHTYLVLKIARTRWGFRIYSERKPYSSFGLFIFFHDIFELYSMYIIYCKIMMREDLILGFFRTAGPYTEQKYAGGSNFSMVGLVQRQLIRSKFGVYRPHPPHTISTLIIMERVHTFWSKFDIFLTYFYIIFKWPRLSQFLQNLISKTALESS